MKLPEWKNGALLVLRIALGVIFVMHGSQMVLGLFGGDGLKVTIQKFSETGIPPVWGYTAAFTELLGGAALVLGLLTRLAAVGIGTTMVVAVWRVHLPHGFFLQNQGYEYNLALFAMSAALVLMGGGNYSLDAKFFGHPRSGD